MNPVAYLILLLIIVLPIAWFISEFSKHIWLRIVLGMAAIASTMGVAYVVGHLYEMNFNATYGEASNNLIQTTISEIEDGNIDRVMRVLRGLDLQYHPTYENKANYDTLVAEAVSQMKGNHDLEDKKWDISPFSLGTWHGHWEDHTGFWLVISIGQPLQITRSGEVETTITEVTISDDFTQLRFKEDDRWLHELSLTNQYEAVHVWRDLSNNSIWKTNQLHKLIRATPAQKEFTKITP